MNLRREQILKLHSYAITPLSLSQKGRWQTCYKDEKGKRKNIKAQSKEELLKYKATVTNSSNTVKRHKQHYRKYFEPSVLHEMKVKKIDELILEQDNNRYVILVPKAIAILEKIPKQGSCIFMRNGERITSRQIAYVLEKFAERQGVRTKSTHKMRKTYASNLNANGVPLDCIREMLGHSSLSTTLGYVYNPLTESETYNLISKAL